MLIFKCALIVLSSSYILSLCSEVVKETNFLDTGLAFMYIASGALEFSKLVQWIQRLPPTTKNLNKEVQKNITNPELLKTRGCLIIGMFGLLAGKIIYDRYQQVHVLGSLTPNPNVTLFANRIASFSATFLSLGFLVYFFLFLFKVDEQCLRALNIFLCGFGTLYMWVQCIVTTYISTLFYDRRLTVLRQCLANVSFLFLVVLAIFGAVSSFLPEDGGPSGVYVCHVVSSLCSYTLTAIFCTFILSFEKDYEYFSEGLRSEMLLDDDCSLNNTSLSDSDSIFGPQELISNAIVIKASIACGKVS